MNKLIHELFLILLKCEDNQNPLIKNSFFQELNYFCFQQILTSIQYNLFFMSLEEIKDISDVPEPIESLSADKYGKAAFVELTYTPRKLKENLLYIQAMTMKKQQEKSNQLREFKAQNQMLLDRLDKLKREKDGVEDSLNQQITMYKKLISEMEYGYEQKIKNHQAQFNSEMKIIIEQREEDAKVSQAQKQLLQDEVQALKRKNNDLQSKFNQARKVIDTLNAQRQKLHLSQKEISFELEEAKQLKKAHEGKAKNELQQLKRKMFQAQQGWKTTLHQAMLQKQRQIENVKRKSLQDLSKLEQKSSAENELKNSEIQIVTKTFNSQFQRVNLKLNEREKAIEDLNKQLSSQKQKFLEATRAYDKLVNGLIYEKNRLATDKDVLKVDNVRMLEREKLLSLQPLGLNIQLNKLKQLLLESFNQLSECKDQLMLMDKQRSDLLIQLNHLGQENQVLRRSRRW